MPTTVIDRSWSFAMPSSVREDFSSVVPSPPGPYERSRPVSAETAYTVPSTPTAMRAFSPSSATGSEPSAPMPLTAVNGAIQREPAGSITATVSAPSAADEPGARSAESDRMTRAGSIVEMVDPTGSATRMRDPLCRMSYSEDVVRSPPSRTREEWLKCPTSRLDCFVTQTPPSWRSTSVVGLPS